MLIPSIDLMGGKIVQLVQGKKKALEFENFDEWIERFSSYPLVQLIDLDAAMEQGANHRLIAMICKRLPCQVGGGIRSIERARELLDLGVGAQKVVFGSILLKNGAINVELAKQAAEQFGVGPLTFALDSRGGKIAIRGWKEETTLTPLDLIQALEPYCSTFFYTNVDTEGCMTGFPMEMARQLRQATNRRLIVAGGIKSMDEVYALDAMGIDAVVGMAIYTGAIQAGTKSNLQD
jgi:phosphoribosylformimino-5-aminoimidazole carboxamide ribotide isomerase